MYLPSARSHSLGQELEAWYYVCLSMQTTMQNLDLRQEDQISRDLRSLVGAQLYEKVLVISSTLISHVLLEAPMEQQNHTCSVDDHDQSDLVSEIARALAWRLVLILDVKGYHQVRCMGWLPKNKELLNQGICLPPEYLAPRGCLEMTSVSNSLLGFGLCSAADMHPTDSSSALLLILVKMQLYAPNRRGGGDQGVNAWKGVFQLSGLPVVESMRSLRSNAVK
ncbi:hypothetical protein VNO77_19360 [Canavalia gladiata]|uniref:Uncharacterized protein n=1 Tax=Canavalia gladiata TaxID=3824 RepID=A0AAN9LMC6_CANGL